nr:hypothetical protein [Tanacetum cinerariifolium]
PAAGASDRRDPQGAGAAQVRRAGRPPGGADRRRRRAEGHRRLCAAGARPLGADRPTAWADRAAGGTWRPGIRDAGGPGLLCRDR